MNLVGLTEAEAVTAQNSIISAIATAFQGGVTTALHLHTRSLMPQEQVEIVKHYLDGAGLETTEDAAAVILMEALLEVVRIEEKRAEDVRDQVGGEELPSYNEEPVTDVQWAAL